MSPRRVLLRIGLILAFGAALACGSDSGPGSVAGPNGNLTVLLTDDPFDDAQSVQVTFSDVSVHRAGDEGFVRLPFADGALLRTCDLKRLEGGRTDVLGVGPLPEGHYTQIRLTVVAGAIYFDDRSTGPQCSVGNLQMRGAKADVTVPSGEVRLNREFDVKGGLNTLITLDFDGGKSLRQSGGGYILQPVIRVMSIQGP